MERLDKVLSNLGYGTRKEIKQVVKKGFVTVNDEKVKYMYFLYSTFSPFITIVSFSGSI